MTKLLEGKKGLVVGLSNKMGMAWGISELAVKNGAELAISYIEPMEKRVLPLAEELNAPIVVQSNVQDDESLDRLFAEIEQKWGKLDFLVHAVGFSDKSELSGEYVNTSRENFKNTMDISAYSLTELARRAKPLMKDGGSIITLTYFGGEKVMANYNVMGVAKAALDASVRYLAADLGKYGIRVNNVSAGPIKTLAASGISEFKSMFKFNEITAPLRRNMTMDDVSKTSLYLLSDLSSGVTGELHHVDCGYNIMGMLPADTFEYFKPVLDQMKDND